MKLLQYITGTSGPKPDSPNAGTELPVSDRDERRARYMAEHICTGFQLHDRGQRNEALEAFYEVDRNQFAHLSEADAHAAAEAYVDSLWAKDNLEKRHLRDGVIDSESIRNADWSVVQEPLEQRAEIVGMDVAYAEQTTEAWRLHKTGGDYWSSFLEAQLHEFRAATGNPSYPDKPKEGLSGYGPAPMRYVLAVELHDLHTPTDWEEAIRVMAPYYREIIQAHEQAR